MRYRWGMAIGHTYARGRGGAVQRPQTNEIAPTADMAEVSAMQEQEAAPAAPPQLDVVHATSDVPAAIEAESEDHANNSDYRNDSDSDGSSTKSAESDTDMGFSSEEEELYEYQVMYGDGLY